MRATFVAGLAIVASAVCLEAFGQINTGQNTGMTGGFGTSGGIGTTTTGMTGTTGMTTGTTSRTSTSSSMFGSRTYGQGLTSGSAGFTGGMASGGRGLTGMSGTGGMGGMGGTTGTTGMSTTGTQFMQQARQAGFVGADSRDYAAGLLGGIMAGQSTQGQSINQRLRGGTGTLGTFGTMGTMGNLGRTGALGALGSTMRTGALQPGMLQSGALRTGMGAMTGRNVGTGAGFGLGGMGTGAYGAGRGTMANREVPATLQVAFDHPQPQRSQVNSKLAERLTRSPTIRFRSPLEVNLQSDGTVVLRGTVATAHDRAVAERLARLEPGVWRVQNELQVATEQPEQPGRSN